MLFPIQTSLLALGNMCFDALRANRVAGGMFRIAATVLASFPISVPSSRPLPQFPSL